MNSYVFELDDDDPLLMVNDSGEGGPINMSKNGVPNAKFYVEAFTV